MAFPKKAKKVLGSSSCLRRKYINLFIRISGFRSVKEIYRAKQGKTIMLRRGEEHFLSCLIQLLHSFTEIERESGLEENFFEYSLPSEGMQLFVRKLCARKIMCKLLLVKIPGLKNFSLALQWKIVQSSLGSSS